MQTSLPVRTSTSGKAAGAAELLSEPSRKWERDTTPNPTSSHEQTPSPLFLATSQGYLAGIEILIKADPVEEDVEDCMKLAFAQGKQAALELLVGNFEQRIDRLQLLFFESQNATNESKSTIDHVFRSFPWNKAGILKAMRTSISHNDIKVLQFLVDKLSGLNDEAEPPISKQLAGLLQLAVDLGRIEAVTLLQEAGVDLFATVQLLLSCGDLEERSCGFLHVAVHARNHAMVSYLLSKRFSPNLIDSNSQTPLHYAVIGTEDKNSETIIRLLLSDGASVSASDNEGRLPLRLASLYRAGKAVSVLLDAGADVNAMDNSDATPLHYCLRSYYCRSEDISQALHLLLEAGLDTKAINKQGYTPAQ